MTSERILRAATVSTVVLAVCAAAAAAFPDALRIPYAVVSLGYFVAGCVAFVWGYAVAIGRSRTEELSVAGIFFLAGGAAPKDVRTRLVVALVAQTVVALAAAAVRPFTAVAFGVLAPMLALGLMGLWGGRFGTFPAREDHRGRRPAA